MIDEKEREIREQFLPITRSCMRVRGVEREKEKRRKEGIGKEKKDGRRKERRGSPHPPYARAHWERRRRRGEATSLSSILLFSMMKFFITKISPKKERLQRRYFKEKEENSRGRKRERDRRRERE